MSIFNMTTTDSLMLIQTIVLALTAVILVWYTVETYKIRKKTSEQNDMMAKQLIMMQQSIMLQISSAEPIFEHNGGSHAGNTLMCNMVNRGAPVKNLTIVPEGKFIAKIVPQNIITNGESCSITIENLPSELPDKLYFKMHFEDIIRHKQSKKFAYVKAHSRIFEANS